MHIRLVVSGVVDGIHCEFWKDVEDAPAVPRIGDVVSLGVQTEAPHHLNERAVERVSWSASLELVRVGLVDLHAGWLQANRQAFHQAGWLVAMAADGQSTSASEP